jgi:hypothetical protein
MRRPTVTGDREGGSPQRADPRRTDAKPSDHSDDDERTAVKFLLARSSFVLLVGAGGLATDNGNRGFGPEGSVSQSSVPAEIVLCTRNLNYDPSLPAVEQAFGSCSAKHSTEICAPTSLGERHIHVERKCG